MIDRFARIWSSLNIDWFLCVQRKNQVITHRELDDSLAQKVRIAGSDPDIGRGANTYVAMWHKDPAWK